MANKKHICYSVDELIENQEFVSMVKKPDKKEEWELFLQSHQESRKSILQAREMILLFKTSEETLHDEKKYKLWKNISRFSEELSGKSKVIQKNAFVKIAASFLIIVSLGALLYLKWDKDGQEYQFSESKDQLKAGNPVLVLSNGDQVSLDKTEPDITVLKNQDAIRINRDSIVKNQPSIDEYTREVRLNEVVVPFGKKSKLELSDGTKVWLNAGSRFAFPQEFKGKTRKVFLEGEGYFEVARNDDQPFIISANSIAVEVLGTKFNVCAYHSDNFIETVLLEGRVRILEQGNLFNNQIVIASNQKATYNKIQKDIEVRAESVPKRYMAWVEGWYQFQGENLEQVLKKLERYYNVSFEYEQSAVSGALPVSGKLDLKDSLNEVMTILSGVTKFKYRISGNRVIIGK